MVRVKPITGRSTVSDTLEGLRISIPSRKNVFMIAFLSLWLVGWGFGEVMVSGMLLRPPPGSSAPVVFMIVWLGMWTMGGAFCIYAVLWSLFGREVITLRGDVLSIRREVLAFGRTREYDLSQVRNLRVSPVPYNPFDFRAGLHFWGIGGGIVAFDYGAGTVRFGAGVQEGEASDLVKRLSDRHPLGRM